LTLLPATIVAFDPDNFDNQQDIRELGADDAAFTPAKTLRNLAASGGKFTEIDTGGLKV
jgi:hypothetical protein